MANELARLKIVMEAESSRLQRELERVNRRLDSFGKTAKRHLDGFARNLKFALGGIGIAAVTRFTIDTAASFEKLQASLKTVTGSAEDAKDAFNLIQDFAATTPYQLQQVTEAFIKLKALGLDASVESLRSYGNTAAAMGKTLNQFIEAVADAATFEFERLKEFGIKAKQQADSVSFTFQGTTTTVGKNAQAITAYLQKIGNVQFAGAMAEQMDTLSGKFSNFQDAVARLAAKLSDESGLSSALKRITNGLTEMINAVAGGPAKIAQLREELEKLENAGPARRTARGTRGGSSASAIVDTIEQINEELIKLGGPVGIRLAIQKADDQIREISERLETSSGRAANSLKRQLRSIKAEREALFKELEKTELSFGSQAGTKPPPELKPPKKTTTKATTDAFAEWKKGIIDVSKETELLQRKLKYLDDQELAGNITTEEHRIELEKLTGAQSDYTATLEKTLKGTKEKTQEIGDGAAAMGWSFQSAFEDAVISGEKFSDVLKGLEKDIAKIVLRQTITAPLGNAISQGISQTFPGFASGGSFTVGGKSGTDTNLVSFWATKGERVSVTPAGQASGGTVVNIYEAPPGTKVDRTTGGNRREAVNVVIGEASRDIARGGLLDQAIQRRYGLKPQGIVRS